MAVFANRRINASRLAATHFRSGPVARNGLSLARNGSRLRGIHSGVNVPGLLLRSLPLAKLPVRPLGSATVAGSPRLRPLHRFGPVAVWLRGSASCAHGFHSPLGLLPPSGSERSTATATCRPAFRIRPISVRSPQPVLFLVVAMDQRSRLATFPEACCSSNLLEPSPLCA